MKIIPYNLGAILCAIFRPIVRTQYFMSDMNKVKYLE